MSPMAVSSSKDVKKESTLARLVGSGMFVMDDVLSHNVADSSQVLLVLLNLPSSTQYAESCRMSKPKELY